MANVRVALRVRPLNKREKAEEARIIVNVDEKIARIRNIKLDYKPESSGDTRERLLEFGFDYCYWSLDPDDPKYASQEVVFQDLGTTVLSEAIQGYNVCLFAYGQTGSGKTYTMMGTPASIGLTPRICEGLFSYNDGSPDTPSSSRIEVSFLEIYNERVRDLLHQPEQKKPYTLRVREHPEKGPYVQGLSQHVVTEYEQVVALLEQGMENRITAATHVHDASSRSHAIFTIQYTQAMLEDNLPSEIASKINLVDLAGSERASPNYCKDRLTEGSNINRSLVTLGIVISALAQNSQMSSSCQSINSILSDGDSGLPGSPSGSGTAGSRRQPFVPYRDSILTWLLKDSLGGNSKTIMIATVSPASSSYNETMSTLRYASNAKNIINKPRVNEDTNVKLIRELREEINRLKAMLRSFEMRTVSPFSEERDGNLTELVLQNELKIEQLTKDWTDKWTDKAALMEQYNVDINEGKARVTIGDSGLPHLIAVDDDILSTGVVIYYLKEGTTNVGSGDHDIVLQGENIQQDHCVIQNKFGVVELRSSPGAPCSVNGQEVEDVCRLSQGAIIVLGKSHRFRFNHPAEAAVLRQIRSDSQASFVSDCSLEWLDLSGDFSSSSKGNSLISNTSNSESPPEEYQQRLKELEATYRTQIEEQQKYVEDLKSQIQTAQVKGEKELEDEQCLINQQIQEDEQWLVKEKERVIALCQQKRESSSQTEPKTYVEVEVQNCAQTDVQPSLEEQEGKKLVQLELLRKCSLRRAERNIRRKRVKLQLERIVKKQKLLEAKKTLQQLQAACWLNDDVVKPTLLHVPKVQETSLTTTGLHRSSSSPSGFSSYRRRSLPWTLQTLPNSYSAVLKRKCKSELAQTTKTDEVRNPLPSVSIDCLLNSSGNPSSNGQWESNPPNINANNLQIVHDQRIDLLIKQISTSSALLSGDPQMSKKRQKMDKPRGGAKGSSSYFTAEQPKRRNLRPTVTTGTKDAKLKPLKSPSPLTVGGLKKGTVQEKGKTSPKGDTGKLPQQKSVKQTSISPSQVKPAAVEPTLKGKPTRYNMAPLKSNTQRKPAEQTKISSSMGNVPKMSNRRGATQAIDRSRISTERLNRGFLKNNNQMLEDRKRDDHTDSSDSESFYSIDSLSSAYASALTVQLRQEERQRQRNNTRQKDSDSDDSQMSQDSLAEKEKRKERPNKRRFNKYKTIGATSSTGTSLAADHNSFPLLTTGSVTTGLTKSFSLDSLADADVLEVDSAEELPAEIFWKLQSPRNLIANEDQNKENIAVARDNSGLDLTDSFYLKVNDGPALEYSVTLHGISDYCPATISSVCVGKSQTISPASSSSGLSSQTDTFKPSGITTHGDALSLTCAPTLESQVGVDEMKNLGGDNKVSETEPDKFPGQLEGAHTEAQDRPADTSTGTGGETVPDDESCPPEPSSYLTKCNGNKSDSKSKDNIATSVESSATSTKNIKGVLEISLASDRETLESKEVLKLPLTQEKVNFRNTTANTICENTSDVMSVSLGLGTPNTQRQSVPTDCQESVTSGPLCCESVQKSPSNFKEDDKLDFGNSNPTQSIPPKSTIERDINPNTGFKTEKQTNPVQEMQNISKLDQEQFSVLKHGNCENGHVRGTENTNGRPVYSMVDDSMGPLGDHNHCASASNPLPVQRSKSNLSTSEQGNINEKYLACKNEELVPDTEACAKPRQLAQSLCHESEKAAMTAIVSSPVTELHNHLDSDATEYESSISHKNGEELCFTVYDSTLDEDCPKTGIADNSSLAVRPLSQYPETRICSIESKHEDVDRSDDATRIKDYNEKECSPPKSDGESQDASAKTGKPLGSPESLNKVEESYPLRPECTSNKSQSSNEDYPTEMQPSHHVTQTEQSDDNRAAHNHMSPAATNQAYVSSTFNTQSSNRDLFAHDHTQFQILKEESLKTSLETYPFCQNKNIPLKRETLRIGKDSNSEDKTSAGKHGNDFRTTQDFLLESGHWNWTGNSQEVGYAAEGSFTGLQQASVSSAVCHLLEDMSGTGHPLPYYEAKMQNVPFYKVKDRTGKFSDDTDGLEEKFTSTQADLSFSFPSMSREKDAAVLDDNMEVEMVQCCRIVKFTEEEKKGSSPQIVDPELSILEDGSSIGQSEDAKCLGIPEQCKKSQDSTTSSKRVISKGSYLQTRSESVGDHLNRDDKTQEDNSVQQNYNVSKSNEGENKNTVKDACLHQTSSSCIAEKEYSDSKDAASLSSTMSVNVSESSIKLDTLQDATTDCPNENNDSQDQDKEPLLFRDDPNSGHSIEKGMYRPTSCRSSPREANRELNVAVTTGLSDLIANNKARKVECEQRQLCDQSMSSFTHRNGGIDQVTCAVEDHNSPIRVRDNGGLVEVSLMATGVCGEYSPDVSESTDISSSDTDTSRYLVLKNISGLQNNLVDGLGECESDFPEAVNDISQSTYFNEEMSTCTDSIETPSPDHPNNLDQTDSESDMNEFSIEPPAASVAPSHIDTSSKIEEKFMEEPAHLKIKSDGYAQHNMADHCTQTVQYPGTDNSLLVADVGDTNCLMHKLPDEHPSSLIPKPSHQAEQPTGMVDNTEGLHFSSSDINPFIHSWQQEDYPKPGWRNCTFNSAIDVSSAKFKEQVDMLIRCSSVDEGLNSHNSPFHSHLSSYANAKTVSSTISSLGRNDSRQDITSLDDSQELLSDESPVICEGNRAEFAGISGLQTKLEDYSQLDEIIFLYTSESETCNEPVKRVSSEQGVQSRHRHRKTSKHQRNHTDVLPSKSMRNRNVGQRPASWSSVQNMSLHLSQLLQETSELLGNLSKHNPEHVSKDAFRIQRGLEEQIMKRSVRDSFTQTSVDRGIQTDSSIVNNAQNLTREHNHFLSSPGINVIVKVLGTDSLTHIPQSMGLGEQNCSKGSKTRTQSLPNLHEFKHCKQSDHVFYHSPQDRASTPFLNGLQDMSSTAIPYSSSKSSLVSTNVNKCAEDTVVNSPSSSVVDTTRYHTDCQEKTAMVDRASSPILTVKASKKFHLKLVPESHLNNQNFAKILRSRKRKERELRDLQLNGSQTETDSETNVGNECVATRSVSLRETTRKRASSAKLQRFVSEGCILRETRSASFTNHSSSNSEITGNGRRCNAESYYTSTQCEKVPLPWEHLQSLQNLSVTSQSLSNRHGQITRQSAKELGSDKNDFGSFTITSGNSYIKSRGYPDSPSQMSGLGLHLQEDELSVVESECNTDILLGQEPTFRTSHKLQGYALQDLPMHNKFSNWSGVQCGATKNGMVSSSPDLYLRGGPTKTEASQEVSGSRSQEIERLQRERAEVLSAIHLEMNPLPLTVQLAEAKLSYGIGETDALLRVIQTGKMDLQDTVSIKKQLYERHLKVIENLRKEREERLQVCRRSRSLSPQKQLSASQTSLISLRESELPSRRREYLQQLRRDVVDNTRIQEPKRRAPQCPSEIEVMLKDYQKAREEAKTEIAKARDKLRERAEMERRRLQQGSLTKEDTKMKTLVSTSTLFTNSSLSLSSGPTSGYNSGMTATNGQGSKLGSQETLPRSLDPALGSGRGRSAVRNCDLLSPTSISGPDTKRSSYTSTVESPDKASSCPSQGSSPLHSTVVSYQELAPRVQASAMAEIMSACSYDMKKLHNRQATAGWIYQNTEKDVQVYYKAFSSPTKHGFIGAGVIKRPLHDVWCVVKDISARRLYDHAILTASVHERVSSNIQLVHVVTDTSLCYLKQPRDFCCMAVEFKQEKCYSLCFQSVYDESMPRPTKDTVRGELLPSAWILQPDTINGEAITRVIYMIQVDLGAPAIPSRLLNVISKRQPLVIANLARFLSRNHK
ncbi:stAR-related lipid transfer protein 9 isoform X2 [Dendropsophus ebraccatus]|uniref:stAR-related lipid transfer protein 9 isoform X2 n=1 Tax=Dendropsophus ebraccatus TaxID=150705 RepID=UPI003831ACCB